MKTVFDYAFDLKNETWLPCEHLSVCNNSILSSSLEDTDLNVFEMIRLNPKLMEKQQIQQKIENEENHYILLERQGWYCETKMQKAVNFFLDYFIAYQKNMVLLG